jgi:phosphatidylglycerol:prolipoprotein diacylglycerol transferase
LAAAFLIGYGFIRFALEFTRQPDAQLGLVAGPFSMGQILSGLTILAGIGIAAVARTRARRGPVRPTRV